MSGKLKSVDGGKVSVLSRGELDRLMRTCQPRSPIPVNDDHEQHQRDREELRARSDARKAKWPNTIEALRKKKEKDRQAKLDAEEEKRCEVDKEEAAFQAEQRRLAIERANKILYDCNDRVKAFNSKILLCDVLKDREAQIDMKKRKEQRLKELDKDWFEKEQIRLQLAADAERAKEEVLKQKALQARDMQMEQLEALRVRLIQERDEEKMEGEMIKKKTQALAEEERRQEIQKRKEARDAMMKTAADNKKMMEQRTIMQKKLVEAEDAMIRQFAEQKEENMRERARREQVIQAEKMRRRREMIEAQEKHLAELMAQSDERLENQVQEIENLEKERDAAAAERRRRQQDAMLTSHENQLNARRQRKMEEHEENELLKAQVKERNEMLTKEEELERLRKMGRARQLASYHKKQSVVKERKARRMQEEKLLEAEDGFMQMQIEDARFNDYARDIIDEYREQNKKAELLEREIIRYKTVQNSFARQVE